MLNLTSAQSIEGSAVLQALAAAARADITARKLLVCRRVGIGRELLGALTQAGVPWIGFDPTTPDTLAQELIGPELAAEGISRGDQFELELAAEGISRGDQFELLAILDDAIDEAIATGDHPEFAELAESAGFRDTIRGSIETLRLEDLEPAMLTRAGIEAGKAQFLARILVGYEAHLAAARVADAATELKRAVTALRGGARIAAHHVFILPDQDHAGLRGRLLQELERAGAVVLPADPVFGIDPPTQPRAIVTAPPTLLSYTHAPAERPAEAGGAAPEIFAAANPVDELREVLRRVIAAGCAWDEVEIIASDADVYGCALDTLARGLDLPVTFATGLPVERTRVGRAVARYLQWVQDGFRVDTLCRLLESGDVALGKDPSFGPHVARELRRLSIGSGRDRYLPAIDRAIRRGAGNHDDVIAPRRDSFHALRALLTSLLDATPRVASPADTVAPADIARGIRTLLEFVPAGAGVDQLARKALAARLERAVATLGRPTTYGAALAILRGRLQIRVPAQDEGGPAPWRSAPGHLHFADIENGGFTGRRMTFIVGLDAGRFPGGGAPDALLNDADRHRLSAAARALDDRRPPMMSSAGRIALRRYRLAGLLARLRGNVTLSFSAWDPAEARVVAPASVLLQVFRLRGNALASYENLRDSLHQYGIAAAMPRGRVALDSNDAWLGTLVPGEAAAGGTALVASVFPMLRRGLSARDSRRAAAPSAYHGLLPAQEMRDPRISGSLLSASSLETLGTCGLRYFYRYVLDLRPPDELPDPGVWLDPLMRGVLLHRVFERATRGARAGGVDVRSEAFIAHVHQVLSEQVAEERELRPPPSEYVYARTLSSLRGDLAVFIRMVRDDVSGSVAEHEELTFGMRGRPPVQIRLAGGTLNIRGSIDRVDRLPDGRLVIVDYKTGRYFGYRREPFNGGRRLQHAVYGLAAESLLAARVARAEYQFPSVRGEGKRAKYSAEQLAPGVELVDELLDGVRAGYLMPTADSDDCKFCDFADCCRARVGNFGKITSPLAEWAASAADLDEIPVPIAHRIAIRRRFE